MRYKIFNLILVAIFSFQSAYSQLKLAALISDNMVLQRNSNVIICGWDTPGQEISVRAAWSMDEFNDVADENGKWSVDIPTTIAGGPYNIYISGSEEAVVKNVLMGDVWICSGQSNMEYKINWMGGWNSPQFERDSVDIVNNKYPHIRLFTLEKNASEKPLDDCKGSWKQVSTETVADFSAVAYFFGRELNRRIGVPVGLVSTNWGGTPAEAWTSAQEFEHNTDLAFYKERDYSDRGDQRKPSRLFNGMISPLLRMKFTGVIWYQGEANVGDALEYRKLFPAMINDWRYHFKQGDFPFYFVQIAPYNYSERMSAALLREAQLMTLSVPGTGMVVTTDIGNPDDIHPIRKQEVGRRLARNAFALHYGVRGLTYSGPIFERMEIIEEDGMKRARLFFRHTAYGLEKTEGDLKCFKVAGEDRVFYDASAVIEGDNVIVWSEEVPEPVAVRFGFTNTAEPNLYNSEGLPASPFRTDNWEIAKDIIQ